MITTLRKHRQWLMIVILILAIPFIFYFAQTPDFGAQGSTDLGRIYDRQVTQVEFHRNVRLLNLARNLGLSLSSDLMMTNVASEGEMYAEFTWNRLVLRQEAEKMGIQPTSGEVTAFVKTMPRFQTDGRFDINKYTEFTETMLPSLGFKEAQVEEIISDQLTLNRLKELLGTGMQAAESESAENYQRAYGKMQVAVVRLQNEDFEKEIKITDDEIAKYYEAQKAQLKTEEKRRVEFVTFVLTEEEKKLTGKERVDALQRVADRANDFSQALLEKDANFGQIAARFQSPVLATAEFTAAAPDPQLTTSPQATQMAFQLSQQTPFSDPVQGPDGFNILHLLGVTEARPLNLDEAKPKITETLKAERLRELISKKGGEIAGKLRDGLKMGTALEKVAEQNGVKLERIPAFAAVEKPTPKLEPAVDPAAPTPPTPDPTKDVPDFRTIKSVVGVLNAGEVSDYTPAAKGGLIAVLEKRDPADPAGYAEAKTQFEQRYLVARRAAVFVEWMRGRRRTANVVVATG